MEIKAIPDIRKTTIIEAVNTGTLAIFTGAGVSRLMGCMGWQDLSYKLLDSAFVLKDKAGSSLLDWRVIDDLKARGEHRKSITICDSIFTSNGHHDEFMKVFSDALTSKPSHCLLQPSENIYHELNRLHGCHITTNADPIFQSSVSFKEVITGKDIQDGIIRDELDPLTLYPLHGLMAKPDSLVFTLPDYLRFYRDKKIQDFLNMVFSKYTVLFVGYGLSELELLQYILPERGGLPKRFCLQGYRRGEEKIADAEQMFYDVMGITLVPFELDVNGYAQLFTVIREWADNVTVGSKYIPSTYKIIDEFLKSI